MIDKDGNGQLSKQEIQKYMRDKVGGSYDSQIVDELFNELNTNSDQLISKDEFSHGYIKAEANLRATLNGIERSIYDDNQQQANINKEIQKISAIENNEQIGILRMTIQNGCFIKKYKGKLSNAEKSKVQLEVHLTCQEALDRLKERFTKTSLNCEYPLWGDRFSFYLLNSKGICYLHVSCCRVMHIGGGDS